MEEIRNKRNKEQVHKVFTCQTIAICDELFTNITNYEHNGLKTCNLQL